MDINEATAKAFLSIQAQDFIEDYICKSMLSIARNIFLSIQAQDFIEEDGGENR